jgi:hypothetical protein
MLLLALGLFSGYAAAEQTTASLQLRATGESMSVPADTAASSVTPTPTPTPTAIPLPTPAPAASHGQRAVFGRERASRDARRIADWIVDSADNKGLPFLIVDKIDARVFVFDPGGRIQGAAPALLGSARGDDSVPGIGDREFADMPPETRTTPAGRFVAALGTDTTHRNDVLWVDYDAAVSLHRVVTNVPKDRRLARLATPTPLDNRITYGCINVPVRFYDNVVSPAFTGTEGIVYVLPETRPSRVVFNSYDVDEQSDRKYASQTQESK